MMSKEDVISLIVECDHSPALEVRIEMEEGAQQTLDGQAESRSEVVHDDLRFVLAEAGRVSQLLAERDRRASEVGGRSVGQRDQIQSVRSTCVLLHDEQMREAAFGGRFAHALDAVAVTSAVDRVRQTAFELTTELDGLRVRLRRGGQNDFGLFLEPEERRQLVGVDIVQNIWIVVLQVGRIGQTLIVDRLRLLFGLLILLSFDAFRFRSSDSLRPIALASFSDLGLRHFGGGTI